MKIEDLLKQEWKEAVIVFKPEGIYEKLMEFERSWKIKRCSKNRAYLDGNYATSPLHAEAIDGNEPNFILSDYLIAPYGKATDESGWQIENCYITKKKRFF